MDAEDNTQYAIFKLITGEEIIAEAEDNLNVFTLTAPRTIIPRRGPTSIELGLGYWFIASPDDTFIIDKDKVIAYSFDVDADLISGYIKNTTGLEIAKAMPPSLIKV